MVRLQIAILALLSAHCGRVGIDLLPLEGGAADGGRVPDSGSDDDGGDDSDAAVDAMDAGEASDAAISEAGDAAISDASSGGGADACVDASADGGDGCVCDEASYVPDAACGVGYCRSTATPSACVAGVESPCAPGSPLASDDTSADDVDDDCDGMIDEDACVPRMDTYGPGSFSLSPPTRCTTVTVKLWGGAGAAGDAEAGYWGDDVVGGHGGAGGYASSVMTVTDGSLLQLDVGEGGRGCGAPGNGGDAAHSGGTGGTGIGAAGTPGADGSLVGGAGGNSNSGGDGGAGSFGGGGGGAGTQPGFARQGDAGGGGAATVLNFDSTVVIAGGGGGGGGGGSDIATAGHSGGNGGTGCGGNGAVATNEGGGGGGGGACEGSTTNPGSGRMPYDPSSELGSGAALGGDGAADCQPGGDGYAIVTFSR